MSLEISYVAVALFVDPILANAMIEEPAGDLGQLPA